MKESGNPSLLLNFLELHRSHPLVSLLADHLIENALQNEPLNAPGTAPRTINLAARCAATVTDAVTVVTTVYLLRLRHQLSYIRRKQPYQMMAEETVALAVTGRNNPEWLSDEKTAGLLECVPTGNLPHEAMTREITRAIEFLRQHPEQIDGLARDRANRLLEDHRRVREAARDVGQYSVNPCLPVDLIGVYVLLPDAL